MRFLATMKRVSLLTGVACFVIVAAVGILTFFRGDSINSAQAQRVDANSTPVAVTAPESVDASSSIPYVFNYQGILRRGADNSLANDSFDMTFSLYANPVPTTGEKPLFTQKVPAVVVRDGIFNVVLGDDPDNSTPTSIPIDAFDSAPRFVGIRVDRDPSEMLPRQRLYAVPWSLQATKALTLAPRTLASSLQFQGSFTPSNLPPDASLGVYPDDAAWLIPTYVAPQTSDLRLYILDNPADRFSIWGNSCAGGNCNDLTKARLAHAFSADGTAYHGGNLEAANLTLNATDLVVRGRGGGVGNNGGAARALVDMGPASGLVVNFANDFGKLTTYGDVYNNGPVTNASSLVNKGAMEVDGCLMVGASWGYCGTEKFHVEGGAYFSQNVYVNGKLTAVQKNFKIDHPLDPANKYLIHSSVESPDMMNIYNGNVTTDANGDAAVVLPDYFQALNRDYRYQLTVIGQFAQAIVAQEIQDNRFAIKTDKPNVKVSWQVTGIRQDAYAKAHPLVVEQDKPAAERGYYQFPELYGQPESFSLTHASDPKAMLPDKTATQ